ncbi:Periplasmic aromatic aldehyde oxidoreductase, molybdenum binding subunit YagR [Acidisarcina polymorpha]|uniref:Periplasmic aromatic aldehyde oxidoreductase, molybdenum binding subunit YagR n=2 Tax=Acidisarcina polymorpha TaxID=2211140 RepID=A0A2Z5FV83_9BACT|nr:Periplasmic aromatic aldehyde oxidoreductase, molybdenum binding subunit YagR [Acidisarcina polymorpha]
MTIEELAYGIPVVSTIASGHIRSIDSNAAEAMPGVLGVLHHGNVGDLFRPAQGFEQNVRASETRPPFEDDVVYYYGQYIALILAETFEQGQAAAAQVKVTYDTSKPIVRMPANPVTDNPPAKKFSRGDTDTAFAQAAVKLDETYTTPVETHNPMEMHATIAVWKNGKFTLYESTQGVVNHHNTICQMLGMPLESVQVISPFVGSGFGCKLFPWPQSLMAAVAARHLDRPVKVSVPRNLMFTTVGHRPYTRQRMKLGATSDGKLVSLSHEVLTHTSMVDDYMENCTEPTGMLYSCPNISAIQHLVHLNVGTPTPMRGPGTTPGLFAIESAMDELAIKLNMDPLELRLKNYAETDEQEKKPFSSKHLRECYQTGAERFGWSKRTPGVGSMRDGNLVLGWGMATSTWPAFSGGAEVHVRLLKDGTARVSCGTQDIGTGTYTVFAQVVSEKTGLPMDKIKVVLGDSSLSPGPMSGGSAATASFLNGLAAACNAAVNMLIQVAIRTDKSPFQGADPKTLKMSAGCLHAADKSPDSGTPFPEILALRKLSGVDGKSNPPPAGGHQEKPSVSSHSFGAQFCEVAYDPGIVQFRVRRWLTVVDGGRIINPKAGGNQITGAVVMGIGMGLFEETIYDTRNGKPVNNNFADYLVATNKDIPKLECIFLNYPDLALNEYGARGIGEIGLTGVASALAMAIYHATGVRVRDLPITIDKLIASNDLKIA